MPETTLQPFAYPPTKTVDQVDDYHGTIVADPYRWLEDERSAETREWINAQNELTFEYLRSIPIRETLRNRMTELWDRPRYSPPSKRNGKYFFLKNDGLQNQGVFYRQERLDSPPEVILDPNTFSQDGTTALSTLAVSPDARYLAYALSEGGSDWQRVHLRDLETGQDMEDRIEWVKFSAISWTLDNRGFFYSRYPVPDSSRTLSQVNHYHAVYYHRIGTPQEEDIRVYDNPNNPEWNCWAEVSDDGRYLLLFVFQGGGSINMLGYIDMVDPHNPIVQGTVVMLVDRFEASFSYIGNDGTLFYIQTDLNAPKERVVVVDIESIAEGESPQEWRTLIGETENPIGSASVVQDKIFITSLRNASTVVHIYDLEGNRIGDLPTPPFSTIWGMGGRWNDTEIFYMVTSFLVPISIYRYDLLTGISEPFHKAEINFDAQNYETHQIWFNSKDGTPVPMFVTHRKGLVMDGSNPTILYGYGGFKNPLTPSFSVLNTVLIEQGGVYAVVNLRGGGEFGDEWYRAGTKEQKQNVFDDCIAAAETLIDKGYTSSQHLALMGGSNGGLLVGAVMTQRPDLMAVALPSVGVMDMLRYHNFTIGRAWAQDYGTSAEPDMFPVLYAYSPLHNLKEGTVYPATLITTGDHDDRVVPAHSFKFAARLQKCQAGDAPVLIRIETRGGHGMGKPISMVIEEATDELAFALANMGR